MIDFYDFTPYPVPRYSPPAATKAPEPPPPAKPVLVADVQAGRVEPLVGFVIERFVNSDPVYWNGLEPAVGWTTNVLDALRFARGSDAALMLSKYLAGHGRVSPLDFS